VQRRSGSLWAAIIVLLREWQQRSWTRRALSRLDDRALGDVGISREQRKRECAKWFWQK
jgi:uncharacterized protein YjiS (DUF1127 family)